MLEGIAASIIAAIVVALAVGVYRRGSVREALDTVLLYIAPTGIRSIGSPGVNLRPLQRQLTRLILTSQSRLGLHKGQFGKTQPTGESEKWQGSGTKEDISAKPRMYLTFWPAIVLHRRGLASRSVALAAAGVEGAFFDNRVWVAQGAAPNMSPFLTPETVSYRHSMAGALILAEFEPWNSITRSVVDAMLDHANKWQKPNGGWKQVSEGFTTADLWASAYAAKLLVRILTTETPFSSEERACAKEQLDLTLSYLEDHWAKRKWAYEKLSAEESSVPLFIDLVSVLKELDHRLMGECLAYFRAWLSPRGDLSDSYKGQLKDVPEEQLLARMAYAFYAADADEGTWIPMFERVSNGDLNMLFSSELAFVLDMSFAYD